jgi:hypothetical protein
MAYDSRAAQLVLILKNITLSIVDEAIVETCIKWTN